MVSGSQIDVLPALGRLVGSVSSFPLGGRNVTVRVHGFAAQGYTADVQIDY